ncbi:type VI immunity family protein [Rahnella bruchi]|uniref:type VI immunity family protein n=2 Tax=Rahnella bruchi TaxID=1510573 RepID=UPI000EA1B80F|nr:type VI immunity family protein [Rahnella bruchi]
MNQKNIKIPDLELEKLDSIAVMGNKSIEACFALGVELFITPKNEDGNISMYQDFLICIEKYYLNFKDQLNTYVLPNATRISKIKGDPVPRWHSALEKISPHYGYGMNVYYDNRKYEGDPVDATPWQISCLGEKFESQELSAINASMSVCNTHGENNFETLFAMTLQWCERLKPSHGSAGFCFAYAPNSEPLAKWTWPLLQRHPGVDHQDTVIFSLSCKNVHNRIKGVNWLTILGDDIVAELGGIGVIHAKLGEKCRVHSYEGGVIIIAGPIPQLGDTYENFIPERYKSVARLTKPIRFENYRRPFLKLPKPIDAVEASIKWIKRFDEA